MKIAITAPTGHIGRKLVDRLLDHGRCQVILLCRHPDKVEGAVADGAKVFKGDLRDPHFVEVATQGVDALFWLTPPNDKAEDFHAYQKKLGLNAAQAIRRNKIKRVVNLSAIGAQLDKGTGPIAGLHDVEVIIESACQAVGCNLTHLRAAFFQENFEVFAPEIGKTGTIALPVRAEARAPMVSTADIADVAADLLLDDTWRGCHVKEVVGPREYSFREAAKIIGKAVGRPVHFEQVSADAARHAMEEHGVSHDVAENYVEMYQALDKGLMRPSPASDEAVTAPTDLEDFARDKLAREVADETPTKKTATGAAARRIDELSGKEKTMATDKKNKRDKKAVSRSPNTGRKAAEKSQESREAAREDSGIDVSRDTQKAAQEDIERPETKRASDIENAREQERLRRPVSEDNPRRGESRGALPAEPKRGESAPGPSHMKPGLPLPSTETGMDQAQQ
ncbi:MAG: NmrA family NAD(P)-binding protein [Planctomycetes bacterium]|nr:NmrA family NAD(P)-binding protein [Planctomycetota bacterium]